MSADAPDLGPKIDWRPVQPPARAAIDGTSVRLEPLDPAAHAADLFALSKDAPAIWDYLPYGPFADEAAFTAWLTRHAATADPLAFAVIDRAGGRAAGVVTFMSIVPTEGVIEIGHIWFTPPLQRTRQATEAIYLLLRHAFDLGYRRMEWKCHARNAKSRAAAERFGFTYEGTFRQHRVVKGRNRDTAWYAIVDGEWPRIQAGFERWLADDNFAADGRQRAALRELIETG